MSPKLYIVATPIGNLEDITLRAVRVLKEVDVVACEDTRVTSKLLKAYEMEKPTIAVHQHTSQKGLDRVKTLLEQGKSVAYVSDAGTPGINDPGGKLVEEVLQAGFIVEPIPGVSAVTTIASVCGFAMDEFTYIGFLPHKKGRQTLMKEMAERETPTIFFESTHRIDKALTALQEVLQEDRQVCLGRELTKLYETIYRGNISEVRAALSKTSTKGEFVVVIGPRYTK